MVAEQASILRLKAALIRPVSQEVLASISKGHLAQSVHLGLMDLHRDPSFQAAQVDIENTNRQIADRGTESLRTGRKSLEVLVQTACDQEYTGLSSREVARSRIDSWVEEGVAGTDLG